MGLKARLTKQLAHRSPKKFPKPALASFSTSEEKDLSNWITKTKV
ncbi:uncharacterized protein METZ01_LOCUS187746 [marine metagenome]|uniref:Uncharacterized protein n=1 Tax=marine metagenome TaxID=408172 RepID=A0A382DA36_9ZZZZ